MATSEQDAPNLVEASFRNGTISSVDFGLPVDKGEIRFNCNPCFNERLIISVLGEFRTLEDGMLDFNWYYRFWRDLLQGELFIRGVEFDVDDY